MTYTKAKTAKSTSLLMALSLTVLLTGGSGCADPCGPGLFPACSNSLQVQFSDISKLPASFELRVIDLDSQQSTSCQVTVAGTTVVPEAPCGATGSRTGVSVGSIPKNVSLQVVSGAKTLFETTQDVVYVVSEIGCDTCENQTIQFNLQ